MGIHGPIWRQILSCVCGEKYLCDSVHQENLISSFAANIMTVAHGSTNIWPTANFLALQKADTPLPTGPLSLHEATLVMSSYYIGAIISNLTIPHVLREFGCKRVLLAGVFPQIVSCFAG